MVEACSRREPFGWLAFHRPPNGEVSTPCHRQPGGEDVLGGVHVGVVLVPASDAPEDRLALAGFSGDVLAGMTGQRRVRGVDLDYLRAVVTGGVFQGKEESAPAFAGWPGSARLSA